MKFEKITQTIGKLGFGLKKNSPVILVGMGIAGFIGTAVAAYHAKPKIEAIVEEVEALRENDLEVNRVDVAVQVAKALALPIATGVLSTGAIIWSYKIQNNRVLTLAGVLASSQATQKALEHRIKEKFGDAVYNELTTTEQVAYTQVDEDGNETDMVDTIKKEIDNTVGEWYDKSSKHFKDDHGYNMAMIDDIASALDLRLFSKGSLLLNEVREKLGFDTDRSGALLGWTSASYFNIEKIVMNVKVVDKITGKETGEVRPEIFVKWSQPKYIYDDIDYGAKYDVY